MTIKFVSTLLAGVTLAACSLSAQTALKGKYAFIERGMLSTGPEFVSLGTITIDALGHVTGGEFTRGSDGSADLVLDGSYASTDNSLALSYSTTNSDGDSVAVPLNYRIVGTGDALHAIRTDLGIVSDAQLIPLATAPTAIKGQFVLNEGAQTFVSLTTLTLDGGQASGHTTRKTFGPEAGYDLLGTFAVGLDGAGTLQLQIPSVNADTGETTYTTASYRFIAIDAKQLVAVRADVGPVTSVEISATQ